MDEIHKNQLSKNNPHKINLSHLEFAPLAITYQLYFLPISKVWNKLH